MFSQRRNTAVHPEAPFANAIWRQFSLTLGNQSLPRKVPSKWTRTVITLCIWTIASVAAYDLFLTIKYAQSLDKLEMNPIGRVMMRLDRGEVRNLEPVAFFSSCKFLGTLLVISVLQGLTLIRKDWAMIVSIAVAGFQLMLLTCFLL